jgi:hypothetical protein
MVLGVVAALAQLDSRPRHERTFAGDTIVTVELVLQLSMCEEKIWERSEHVKEYDIYTKTCLRCCSPQQP